MGDDYERRDRPERRVRRRRRDEDYETYATDKPVSVLGIVALVKGILALIVSLIPCFGMFAIPAAGIALFLAVLSLIVARQSRHSMGIPIAATAVSGSAVVASVLWIALLGAMFRGEERASVRPVPPPPQVQPQFKALPPPQKKTPEPKIDDAAFEKKLLEDLAKDRIKEAIRNGPGTPATAAELEDLFTTNVVAADVRYKDKVVAVSGRVVRVVRDDTKAVYTLELATDDPTKTVSCDFTEQTKSGLASCKRGSEVKLRGLCVGRANEFVKIKDCFVVK